ncbi:hypothetical protein Asppvi_005073 [Aspergillus pseudoviridinutans]|uniref:Glycine-rich cell wall structural protein 1 n=1 Tax=Aspergillus pseudoviridinutans TaxID=1517512 RepID=A0A9P3B7L6_9EURO|nr:uncharacterized protein Asppvi_005073 [Aspergillus pseudoviridinutans]GIJ86191.1 hypothetical protein Asppvi_005073 [Aspergillus pseudoviridinutans]
MESVQKAVRDAADGLRNLAFGPQEVTESAAQHGEEPVSGIQGRGTATDPYDAGNRDEQPGAPQTQDNTAVIPEPLESIAPIEVKPTDVSSAHSTSDQGAWAGAGAGTTTALPVAPQESPAPAQEKSQSTAPDTNLGSGPGNPAVEEPSPAQEQTNPTASSADTTTSSTSNTASSSSNKAPSRSEPEKPAPEQRSQTMPDSDSSSQKKEDDGGVPGGVERAPPTTTQNVSVEALKGPQGPAPRDAYEFEKEMDGQQSKTKTDQGTDEKSDSGSHHHKMGHVKERLGKVFKHGNH